MSKTLAERFWSKVDKSGDCWLWTGATSRARLGQKGYGVISNGGKTLRASRVAYYLAFGHETPADALLCHTCDNTLCVNSGHLFLGTHQANAHDRNAKGREARKMSPAQSVNALMAMTLGATPRQCAEWFTVSAEHLRKMRKGLHFPVSLAGTLARVRE